jgi:hypothetical protein
VRGVIWSRDPIRVLRLSPQPIENNPKRAVERASVPRALLGGVGKAHEKSNDLRNANVMANEAGVLRASK